MDPELRVDSFAPKLKFSKEIILYFVYITWRNIFVFLQWMWWKLNGTAATLSQTHQGALYEKSAHVQRVVWRGKADVLCIARYKDFIGVHERFDSPRCVLADNVTLYSVSRTQATFVETPSDMDVLSSKHAPLVYLTQFYNAGRTITIPNWAFKELADEVGDPDAEVTILPNTGRCGSTILSQMFEACPAVVSISEPDAITNFDVLKPELEREEYRKLIRSTIRLICKPMNGQYVKAILLKFRSNSIRQVPAISELFPRIHIMFMYRDRMETVRSMDQAFSGLLAFWSLYVFMKYPIINVIFPKTVARCRYYCYGDDPKTAWMRWWNTLTDGLTIFYYLCMHHCWVVRKYLDYQDQGIELPAIKYEDIMADPENACRIIFKYCGLPADFVPTAVKALEHDSQRGSPLAIGAKQHRKRQEVNPKVLEVCDAFCKRSGIPLFSENLDLPRTITK
jgi:hypothetical protein